MACPAAAVWEHSLPYCCLTPPGPAGIWCYSQCNGTPVAPPSRSNPPYLQARESGYPAEEITRGMRPALEEFLAANPQWEVAEHFENNNGLTVLRRRG